MAPFRHCANRFPFRDTDFVRRRLTVLPLSLSRINISRRFIFIEKIKRSYQAVIPKLSFIKFTNPPNLD